MSFGIRLEVGRERGSPVWWGPREEAGGGLVHPRDLEDGRHGSGNSPSLGLEPLGQGLLPTCPGGGVGAAPGRCGAEGGHGGWEKEQCLCTSQPWAASHRKSAQMRPHRGGPRWPVSLGGGTE